MSNACVICRLKGYKITHRAIAIILIASKVRGTSIGSFDDVSGNLGLTRVDNGLTREMFFIPLDFTFLEIQLASKKGACVDRPRYSIGGDRSSGLELRWIAYLINKLLLFVKPVAKTSLGSNDYPCLLIPSGMAEIARRPIYGEIRSALNPGNWNFR